MRRTPRARLTITVRFSWSTTRLTPLNPSSSSRRRSVTSSSHSWSDIHPLHEAATGEREHVRSAKHLGPQIPTEELHLDGVGVDGDAVERGGPAPPRTGA